MVDTDPLLGSFLIANGAILLMCNGGTGGRLSKLSEELAILVGVVGLLEDQGFVGGPEGVISRDGAIVGGFETSKGSLSSFLETLPLMGNTGNSLFFEFDLS